MALWPGLGITKLIIDAVLHVVDANLKANLIRRDRKYRFCPELKLQVHSWKTKLCTSIVSKFKNLMNLATEIYSDLSWARI